MGAGDPVGRDPLKPDGRVGRDDYLGRMADSGYVVKPLSSATWAPFAALVEQNNGVFGGCWCIGFHTKDIAHHEDGGGTPRQEARAG